MRKLGKIFIFIIILMAGLMLLSWICTSVAKSDSTLTMIRNQKYAELMAEEADTLDIIMTGDSEGYTSVSPLKLWEEHGITAYNTCQVGQYIQETYYMLKTAFKTQNPQLIILETNVLFRSQDAVSDAKLKFAEIGKYYLPVFRFHDIWKPLLTGERFQKNYKGFQINDRIIPYEDGPYMDKVLKEVEISKETRKYMDKIIALCEKNGAKILLVSVPSPVNYDMRTHEVVQEYAGQKELPYLDLNLCTDEMKIEWNMDTMDKGDHMNMRGAEKVTEYLGNYITENYELTDHRTDEAYQDWNQAMSEYDEKVAEALEIIQKGNDAE